MLAGQCSNLRLDGRQLSGGARRWPRVACIRQVHSPSLERSSRMTRRAAAATDNVGGMALSDAAAPVSACDAAAPAGNGCLAEKVPLSELPRPHPKASKTLSKSMNKARGSAEGGCGVGVEDSGYASRVVAE
jgi:hypothetical protein